MGLDMYLSKKSYVKNWLHMHPSELHEITVKKGGDIVKSIKPERISYIVEEVGYWRKFNALHGWFVNNCQDGVDNCQESYVSMEKLKEILGILKQVKEVLDGSPKKTTSVVSGWKMNNGITTETHQDIEVFTDVDKVNELFPTSTGFFFGGTEIDEWYKQDVENTITIFEELLAEEPSDYYYCSSW